MPVAASIPEMTVVPRIWRPAAPAPCAIHSGTQPRMNAKDVIRIGRSRSRAPSRAASTSGSPLLEGVLRELHDEDRVLGRQADQHDEADLPVDVEGEPSAAEAEERARPPRPAPTAAR